MTSCLCQCKLKNLRPQPARETCPVCACFLADDGNENRRRCQCPLPAWLASFVKLRTAQAKITVSSECTSLPCISFRCRMLISHDNKRNYCLFDIAPWLVCCCGFCERWVSVANCVPRSAGVDFFLLFLIVGRSCQRTSRKIDGINHACTRFLYLVRTNSTGTRYRYKYFPPFIAVRSKTQVCANSFVAIESYKSIQD